MPSTILLILVTLLALQTLSCATTKRDEEPRRARSAAVDPSIPRPKVRLSVVEDNKMTTLATYRVLRQVSMFYKLDLLKDNVLTAAMADIMRTNDEKIRECYVSRLEEAPTLKGQIALSFLVSKASGGIRRVSQVGGTLTDRPLLGCISRELAKLSLNPPKSLRGRLVYSFDVVETVALAK